MAKQIDRWIDRKIRVFLNVFCFFSYVLSFLLFTTYYLSHTIFPTPLCHTPSLTHHLSHISFITQHLSPHHLCHTSSFTKLSFTHTTLSRTIFPPPPPFSFLPSPSPLCNISCSLFEEVDLWGYPLLVGPGGVPF